MSELKRTVLYERHVAAGATMVDFGGWEMPVQYPTGIVEEHLYTRSNCGIFDVSHMGRFRITGKEAKSFLQHVLTSNVSALEAEQAQYAIIPDEAGGAVDDAYLYRFVEDAYILVVNAANAEKDWRHLAEAIKGFDAQIENKSEAIALISVQGPKSKDILTDMAGGAALTEPVKNALGTVELCGIKAHISKTGYTGEPIGYEVFALREDAEFLWDELIKHGAKPVGLGARDTLRLEAGLPLYGHELGTDKDGNEIPIFAISLARFAVSFSEEKEDMIGRSALEKQFEANKRILNRDFSDCAALPRKVRPIALTGRGVARAGYPVFKDGREIGYVTSGTMVPRYTVENRGSLLEKFTDQKALRSIGFALLDSDVLTDDAVEIEIRGGRIPAVVPAYHLRGDAPPYARPIVCNAEEEPEAAASDDLHKSAFTLLKKAADNHVWRQRQCVNLIPSEMTASRAVRLLSGSDPSFRYAEHKQIASFYDHDVFYYQGTKFIDEVERALVAEMKKYLGCAEVETRVISGQMSNTAVFSALMDFVNRTDRKHTPRRLGYILNNHIIRGGHLSAQPMGALHDYVAVDPVTERPAVVNFPVCADNPFKIDVEETKKIIERYRPEFIIFGKSMVLHKEPVREIRAFTDEMKLPVTIMYDMAHVLGLVGPHFQKPFEEGAEIVTGSTHKTFFGPQRGVIGANYTEDELKYDFWKAIQTRAFPGSVSNHHLGTMLGQLMAAYEMNAFGDEYQKNVIRNAKSFAKSLKAAGLDVAGDPAISYTETHQVIVRVGYGMGPEIAERLEENNIVVNYQATPEEEGFTASGALRLGVSEMTRFGFGPAEFEKLANLMGACVLKGTPVGAEIAKLRENYTTLGYCFGDADVAAALDALAEKSGI
ncbi:MAG TPA: glycine cleavage system aminomethyltransferase GcvT [Eubacteriales bacterium]|nr:glycine cleavage system aminomethyltransferase GcvT [Eubacteriales bacterium]